jgi:hypothetical protein
MTDEALWGMYETRRGCYFRVAIIKVSIELLLLRGGHSFNSEGSARS